MSPDPASPFQSRDPRSSYTPVEELRFHRRMLEDRARTEAYRKAIRRQVRPGQVVLDIGTGTGILAMFACQAGAKKVYALESGPMAAAARELGRANGFSDRIVYLKEHSFLFRPREKADVLITETFGALALDEGILGLVLDARRRLLKPGAKLIPRAVELWGAAARAPVLGRELAFWRSRPYGLDFEPMRRRSANHIHRVELKTGDLLAGPRRLGRVDFRTQNGLGFEGRARLAVSRAGTCDGLACWFDADLGSGVGLNNRPGPSSHWGQAFLPVGEPRRLSAGSKLEAAVSTRDGFIWRWRLGSCEQSNLENVALDPA